MHTCIHTRYIQYIRTHTFPALNKSLTHKHTVGGSQELMQPFQSTNVCTQMYVFELS